MQFKFRNVDAAGHESPLFARKGRFDGDVLVLDKARIPARSIANAVRRRDRLAITVAEDGQRPETLVIALKGGGREAFVRSLYEVVSRNYAEWRRRELRRLRVGAPFRTEICPHCGATIELTGRPRTRQVWCPWCECVATIAEPQAIEAEFRLCDKCDAYSRPVTFTELYFWFAVVVWGYRYQTFLACRSCLRAQAWRMLVFNLPFVLGVPFAVFQLVRVYAAGRLADGPFAGLDRANAVARSGRAEEADRRYRAIEERLGAAAGVCTNRGRAWLRIRRHDEAAAAFEAALRDCANYAPAYVGIRRAYRALRRDTALATLDAQWRIAGMAVDDDAAIAPVSHK